MKLYFAVSGKKYIVTAEYGKQKIWILNKKKPARFTYRS